jgi:hypothetical protein
LSAPAGIIAPELKRLRKLLARKRREPIRIIIATDPTRPVRTLNIPRFLPVALLTASAILILGAIGLSFSTWSMSGTITGLKNRVMAMMQLADTMAMDSESVAHAGTLGQDDGSAVHVRKPSGGQGRFVIEAVNSNEQVEVVLDLASGDMDEASYRSTPDRVAL